MKSIYLTDNLRLVTNGVFRHWCPGCRKSHDVVVFNEDQSCRSFNGNINYPTFRPSVKIMIDEALTCHYNLVEGVIYYFGDCKHSLAYKNIPLEEIPKQEY